MRNGRNFVAERDPARNPNFSRRWGDDPLRLPDFQHLDRDGAPRVVKDVDRRTIGRWLDKASETHGAVAAESFRQADQIRKTLGLGWEALIQGQEAA